MNSFAQQNHKQQQQSRAVANDHAQSSERSNDTAAQHGSLTTLQERANLRPQVGRVTQLQKMFSESASSRAPVQMKGGVVSSHSSSQPVQRQPWEWLKNMFSTPQPPPKSVEVVPMKNSPFYNIPSAMRLAVGIEDQRANQLALQQLESHRTEPDMQHVFHVHSNASQTTHHAHTHDTLSSQQAKLDKIPKEQALADSKLKAEREAILNKTHIVSTGGPPAQTDVPDTNRQMLVRPMDIVPQLATISSIKGKATQPNLQTFGTPSPPVPDVSTFATMEPEQITAQLIGLGIKGVQEHNYNKMYKEQAEKATKQVVGSINANVRVHVGEGVLGTDVGAKKRAKDVEEALKK